MCGAFAHAAQIACQGTDVGALRHREVYVPPRSALIDAHGEELSLAHLDGTGGQLDLVALASLAVGTHAVHLNRTERRGHLLRLARKLLEGRKGILLVEDRLGDGRLAANLTLEVVGQRLHAPADAGRV